MSNKPILIFDLGAVLIDWNPRYLYRQFFADEATMEAFFAEVGLSEWNAQQDAGRPFAEAIALLAAQYPHHAAHIHAFWERWPEMLGGALEGTVEIMRELRARGHRLFALSNWSAETYPHAAARFEFLQWFEYVALSGRLKLVKPQPEIYAHLQERIARPAAECLFIDDSLANVEAAWQCGWQAIHFTTPGALQVELVRRGIL
ncbi:MAG: HAD family phosphatase [Acidobacteria bacterium]|nr:HAD family phosphatase [Acidobacteriota bacterium]MBI3424593.1 HAD family phosphatase [Acidobacteriota bacterium]